MSLNYRLPKTDYEFTLQEGERTILKPATHALVFSTMFTGINTITEKNVQQVFERVVIFQKVFGAISYIGDEPVFITLQDVKDHIGLSTNASPRTLVQFKNFVFSNLVDDAKREYRDQVK